MSCVVNLQSVPFAPGLYLLEFCCNGRRQLCSLFNNDTKRTISSLILFGDLSLVWTHDPAILVI